MQKTNIIRASGVDKAWRLLAVHGLLQMTMKKSILHVQLVNQPGARSSKVKDDLNRGRLDDGAKRLIVVDVVALREP
jgi:hypothetical protein